MGVGTKFPSLIFLKSILIINKNIRIERKVQKKIENIEVMCYKVYIKQ